MQVHTETLPFIIINISPVIFNNSLYHTYQVLTFHSIQLMHIFQAKTTWHKGINQIIVMWLLVMHARVILRFTSSFTTGHNSWLHSAMGGKKKTKEKKSPLWSSLIVMQDQGGNPLEWLLLWFQTHGHCVPLNAALSYNICATLRQ